MYKNFREASEKLANIKAVDFFFAKEILELIKKTSATPGSNRESFGLHDKYTRPREYDTKQSVLFHLLMKLMSAYSHGHSCIKISNLADKTIFACDKDQSKAGFKLTSYQEIITILESLDYTKLPIHFAKKYNSLYIKRLWIYENEIAKFIRQKTVEKTADINQLEQIVTKLFEPSVEIDWQKQAVIKSLSYDFSIISGGPGTGKTTTVAKLLLVTQMLNQNQQKIALLAPTGKAAQRITESLRSTLKNINFKNLNIANIIEELYKLEGQTIHRFLGLRPNSNHVSYNQQSKAPYDVIIVDEASMLDINIFIKLIRAVAENTKLVLIGDANQLPSVEAGSLLANFTAASDTTITAYTTQLLKNYRSQQYINNLANDVLAGYVDRQKYQNNSISFYDLKSLASCLKICADKYKQLEKCHNYKQALVELSKFRILVANKNLEIGTDKLNQKIEKLIAKVADSNYKGKPIMITQNSYSLGLFNGDVGIVWPDANGKLRAYFDGKQDKAFSLNMLPKHESVYAMTIHKTQGSEFDEVVIILPAEDNEALSKQLLYTAITRAKHRLTIISQYTNLNAITQKSIYRYSNIADLVNDCVELGDY
ncbi:MULTISPECIES: exodeoxyribonuclease V subunit alpha [Francisella]|uniref:RecBCD enzyme subunit RecD n=1 Tax=Francisella opportunistica TaxID=2016517 RepID=A0A345JQ78_9GAMM|nr:MULTISPECIES: exodeoxyribonuclease V subunit alpha [Francisella]APC91172.1 Exodeoxyribonuclease V alpha chain [Francisella sp. MA067296]AXH29474.1 exodeoxyribonuclease V subunit alpha [Francisella opportunistica]AXH31125.1 exodeoxyribonuclease V subunit alpha [Francisella opportunistica]AXH32770.1 exodeoxyribonuclease V subunit alpha [Francisella opportunistica]